MQKRLELESQINNKCRIYGKVDETNHALSERCKLVQKENKTHRDWIRRQIQWEVCKKNGRQKVVPADAVKEGEFCKIL